MPPRLPTLVEAGLFHENSNRAREAIRLREVDALIQKAEDCLTNHGKPGAKDMPTMTATPWIKNPQSFSYEDSDYGIEYSIRREFHEPGSDSPIFIEMRIVDHEIGLFNDTLVAELNKVTRVAFHYEVVHPDKNRKTPVGPGDERWVGLADTVDFIVSSAASE